MKSKRSDPQAARPRPDVPALPNTSCGTDRAACTAAAEMLALYFRVLAEPMRIRIVQLLQERERTVSEIAETLEASPSNVSRHLHVLHDAGVVTLAFEENVVHCAMRDTRALAVCDLVCRSLGEQLNVQGRLAQKLKV